MTSGDRSLAALLLTNRLVQLDAKPLTASEFWSLVERVPDLSVLLDSATVRSLVDDGVLTDDEAHRIRTLLDGATTFAFERERLEEEGIRLVSAFDDAFPARLVERLGGACPSFLTVAGPIEWLSHDGLGVVGSRDADEAALEVAAGAVSVAHEKGAPIVNGLANGVDPAAMSAGFELGASVVGVPAEGIRVAAKDPEIRRRVHAGQLCIASPYGPTAQVTAASTAGRIKLIYALSEVTLVVCATDRSGGTWQGASEALQNRFGHVAVWLGHGSGTGNQLLIDLGATPVRDVHELTTLQPRPIGAAPAQHDLFSTLESEPP